MGYTWGQFRFQLQVGAPGFSTDLLDEYLNTRYASILGHYPWKGLEVDTYLETVATYTTGTLTATLGSNAVAGVGTTWTAGMSGYRIQVQGRKELYVFTYVSATTGTLDRNFEGATIAGATFNLFQNVYTLPSDCKAILEIDSAVTGLPLKQFSKQGIAEAIGSRVLLADPEFYAVDADTPETAPPVLHTVELYPLPINANGLPMRYLKAALGFTGENTGAAPLPFVSNECLLHGCRAEIAAQKENWVGAAKLESKFQNDLAEMVRADAQRKGPQAARLDDHYTMYRRTRVCR